MAKEEFTHPVSGQFVSDGHAASMRPADASGIMEIDEIDTDILSGSTTSATLRNGDRINIVTIQFLDAGSSQAKFLYVGFSGTPFNDPALPGVRRVVPLGAERTFVFAKGAYATGLNFRTDVASDSGAQKTVWEVSYV